MEPLITQSFGADDLTILRPVLEFSISAKIHKIDLIMDQLRKISNPLLLAESYLQVSATATLCH